MDPDHSRPQDSSWFKEKLSDGSYLLCASKHSGDPEAPGESKSSVGSLGDFLTPMC